MASLPCPHCGTDVEPTDLFCPNCTRSLRLNRQDIPLATQPSKARPVIWVILIGLLGFGALVAFPFLIVPRMARDRAMSPPRAAPTTACMSNIKQLTVGSMIYMADYDDRVFPQANFMPVVMPYVKNPSIFSCPQSMAMYSVNAKLLKIEAKHIVDPNRKVFFYEGMGQVLSGVHSGGANVSYCDGSARFIGAGGASSLKWDPK